VFAYLRLLSRSHVITLVTFEKPRDLADAAAMAAQRDVCKALAIRWIPLRYHHRPRLVATAWDLATITLVALREVRAGKIDVLHCRSYVPAFAALAIKAATCKPFIFDMRAFWPEEMVAAGRLRANSALFRILKVAERVCLKQAAAVVSLTDAGVAHLRQIYGSDLETVPFAVIPTCVDLERFRPASHPGPTARTIALGSVGTVLSGWFRLDWLVAFFAAAHELDPDVALTIVSPEDPSKIRQAAGAPAIGAPRVRIFGVAPADVPPVIKTLSAVPMFFTPGTAKLASCPTRLGEVLACGIPVVVNSGVGDIEKIVREHHVGIVVDSVDAAAMRQAASSLLELLGDPNLGARCRRTAEEGFSLESGARTYGELYQRVVKTAPA
jgi:glycosyltransferase involved in cell wall biosynthesis